MLPVKNSHIFRLSQLFEVDSELQKLGVLLAFVEGEYGDAVKYLVGKGVGGIVYKDSVLHAAVLEDAEVLEVDLWEGVNYFVLLGVLKGAVILLLSPTRYSSPGRIYALLRTLWGPGSRSLGQHSSCGRR